MRSWLPPKACRNERERRPGEHCADRSFRETPRDGPSTRDQGRREERHHRQAADPVHGVIDHFGEPLVVWPERAVRRMRIHIRQQDVSRQPHVSPRAQLPPGVGLHRHEPAGENDGEEQ